MESTYIMSLFADKLVEDDRAPVATFLDWQGASWGLYAPKWMLWQQLILLLLIQTVYQWLFAVVNYTLIVKHRRTVAAYLIGWGIVLPVTVYSPYMLIEALQIHNKVLKMSAATTTFVVGFRTIEAMYNTAPATVESSLATYMTYYTTLLHYEWDSKTATRRKITTAELLGNAWYVAVVFHMLSVVLSFEMHYNFEPFASPVKLEEFHFNLDLLSPAHLGNAYCLAVLTFLALCLGLELTGLGEQLKGYYTPPVFFNPLFTSRSPSEFWGRKWNLMIHKILKYGAFLPARRFVSVEKAVAFTFVVSGVMHDYTWSLIFFQHEHTVNADGVCLDCFAPVLWKLTAFFAWNGVVMLLERPLGPYIRPLTSRLPTFMVSTLVILTALPVSHWYSGDWAKGGYFADLSVGVWQIRKLQTSL